MAHKPQHHEIVIRLVPDPDPKQAPHAEPHIPPPGKMNVGDMVHYSSPDGAVRVILPPNCFEPRTADGVVTTQTIKLIKSGNFQCRCFITPPGPAKNELGWRPGDDTSGGFHDVGPH